MAKYKDIERHYEIACEIALTIIEQKARKILREHKNLDEFVMAMGGWFFTRKIGSRGDYRTGLLKGETAVVHDRLAYMEPIESIIFDWDEYLKLTGEPMRFTADGPVVRQW